MDRHKKPRRGGNITPDSAEGRQIGLAEPPLPGGLNHLVTAPVKTEKPEVPAAPKYPVQNAHGVPDNWDVGYARPQAGKPVVYESAKPPAEHDAVPVFIVEEPGKRNVRRDMAAYQIEVPANTADPIRVCSVDRTRVQVSLRNTGVADAATAGDIQFSETIGTVVEERGALLATGATSYTRLSHQGEIWALSVNASPQKLSVILEMEVDA